MGKKILSFLSLSGGMFSMVIINESWPETTPDWWVLALLILGILLIVSGIIVAIVSVKKKNKNKVVSPKIIAEAPKYEVKTLPTKTKQDIQDKTQDEIISDILNM